MLESLKYRYKLSRLFAKKERVRKRNAIAIADARRKNADKEAMDELIWELRTDEESIDESIRIFVTNYLLMQADRLFLPTPPYEDEKMWTQVDSGERRVLTALGISSVRTAMRAELAQRREFFLKVLAALTGVIGAATGLLAIWLKRK